MTTPYGRHPIQVEIFADAYRATGQTAVAAAGLHSVLSDPNTDYLELSKVYISRINEPGEIVVGYNSCVFRKENIHFVIVADRRDGIGISAQHGRSIFLRGRQLKAFVTVPSFEISGQVYVEGQLTPTNLLINTQGSFQPIFEATAAAALYPDVKYSGDLILVRKERIAVCALDPG